MKENKCKICNKTIGNKSVKLEKKILCETCFDFLLSKYKTSKKVNCVLKQYGGPLK